MACSEERRCHCVSAQNNLVKWLHVYNIITESHVLHYAFGYGALLLKIVVLNN